MAATGAHSHDLSVFLSPLEWHSSGKAAAPGLVGIAWLLLAGRAVCLQPLAALQLDEFLWQALASTHTTS